MAVVTAIALGVAAVGATIQIVGNVQKAQAQAAEDQRKANQLEELSKPGGYYDQVLDSIRLDLANVEADRQAAGKMLAIESLQVTRQEAQVKGQITAAAGAGNLAQTGSIVQRKQMVQENADVNLVKYRMQYESQLRGLAGRAASDTASQTKVEFQKGTGLEDAAALKSESDWLSTWGVGLSVAGGVAGFASTALGMDYSSLGLGGTTVQTPDTTPQTSSSAFDTGKDYTSPDWWRQY